MAALDIPAVNANPARRQHAAPCLVLTGGAQPC